jgi:voltage-gated potassium channel
MLSYILRATWKLLALFGGVYFAGAIVFWQFESGREGGLTLGESLYYGIVTLSTVGYGDFYPMTTGGRVVAVVMILFALTALGYFLTKISDAVMEARRMDWLGMNGTKFEGHLVVIGWSQIARITLAELVAADRQVAVVTEKPDVMSQIREMGDERHLFATVGDASNDAVLERVGVRTAATVIICTEDDSQNLILSLNVRSMNPTVRIIVAVSRPELRKTLTASGVTYVASPFELSGRLVASAAFEPEVARFVDDVTSGATGDYDLQQFSVTDDSRAAGKTVGNLAALLRDNDGSLIVAVGVASGNTWDMRGNPPYDLKLKAEDVLVVLGSDEQNHRVGELLGVSQGR